MKKVLSLMLTIALILTTMAVPMVVSAAEGDVTVTATFYKGEDVVSETNPVYPGDDITLKITAVAETTAATVTNAYAMFTLSDGLVLGQLPTGVSKNPTNPNRSAYVNMNMTSISAEGDVLAEIPVTVNSTGVQTMDFVEYYGDIINGTDIVNTTWVDATMTVTAPSVTVSVKGAAEGAVEKTLETGVTATYVDTTSVTVTLAPNGNIDTATITKAEGSAANFTDNQYTISAAEAGTYTVSVKMVGGTEQTYSFIYSAFQADATISLTKPDNVLKGNTVSVPVTITGIGDYTAAMVQFDVTYDSSVLSLDITNENIVYDLKENTSSTYTVTVGKDTDANVTNEGNVTNLVFTANALGDAVVSISPSKVVLATGGITVDDTNLGVETSSVTFVVVPETFATITGDYSATNQPYVVEVDVTEGVNAVVIKSETELNENGVLEKVSEGTAISGGKFNVDTEGVYYYVVASVGTTAPVYKYIGEHKSVLDKTGPVIDSEKLKTLNDSNWVGTANIEESLTLSLEIDGLVADTDFAKFMYMLNDSSGWIEATNKTITIPANTTTTSIKVKAVDSLGNEGAEATISRNYDGSAPTFTLTEPTGYDDDGKSKSVKITDVADEGGSGIGTVTVYKSDDDTEGTVLTDAENVYTYTTDSAGKYTFVVADIAGNKTSKEVTLTFDHISVAAINVAIVKNAEGAADKFIADKNNGMFSYIKITPATVDGAATEFALTKSDETVTLTDTTVVEIEGSAETAGNYVLTVTTTNNNDPNDTNSKTYNFSIAANAEDMHSVDNKPYYTAYDYAVITALTTGDAAATTPSGHTLEDKFTGGLFSADVTGDLSYTPDDVNAILQALQKVQMVGEYDFAIMNHFAPSTTPAE